MIWLRWFVLLLCTQVIADSSSVSLSLPSAGSSSGTDSIRAGDLDCKNSIGGSTNFEFGFTGVVNNAVVPIIGKINCNTLYQLELQRRRLEVERLKQEIEYLRLIQNEGAFNN